MSTALAESELRQQLEDLVEREPERYLFRGQSRDYPTATPSIARCEGELKVQAAKILIWLVGQLRGQLYPADLRGRIKASREEAIALLQHHGWPTPYIDLTDDLSTAFFFALDGYKPEVGPAVMFVIDRTQIPDDHVLVAHHEVLDPELNLRWTRQRGFALRSSEWRNVGNSKELDLKCLPFVKHHLFVPADDHAGRADRQRACLYEELPEISDQLRFLVRSLAEAFEFDELAPELRKFPH